MALDQLNDIQREIVNHEFHGHALVLGPTGTGKTTTAVYRAARLQSRNPSHRVLLLTFNRSLLAYLDSMYAHVLTDVKPMTYHQFATSYLDERGQAVRHSGVLQGSKQDILIQDVIQRARDTLGNLPLLDRSVEAFKREFAWIAGNGITSPDEYEKRACKVGSTLRISPRERALVFQVYQEYLQVRKEMGYLYDWNDIAIGFLEELARDIDQRQYTHIIVDEGQDFSPVMLRSLAEAIPSYGSLTIFADAAQQIYDSKTKMSWRNAGLAVERVWMLRTNYRHTWGIARLTRAMAVMSPFAGITDLVLPKEPEGEEGRRPIVVQCQNPAHQLEVALELAARASQKYSVAVLFRTGEEAEAALAELRKLGCQAEKLDRDVESWFPEPTAWVGTFHAAKGLEFDVVIIPHCDADVMPDPEETRTWDDQAEAEAREARILLAGVSSARSDVVFLHSSQLTSFLPADADMYQVVDKTG